MSLSRSILRAGWWLSSVTLALSFGYYWGHRTAPSPAQEAASLSPTKVAGDPAVASSPRSPKTLPSGFAANETDPERRWEQRTSAPRTPRSEQELAASLEALAAKDHDRAMALALAEPTLRLREFFRNAVLRGWAAVDPDAALAFAMHLSGTDNRPAITAVLVGAAQTPENAIRLAGQLTLDGSPLAKEYGVMAIAALGEAGAFAAAARFAADGPLASRDEWLNEAFARWSQHDPEAALRAFEGLTDAAKRGDALQGLVNGWAEANPVGLAEYALRLPAGAERALALARALPSWVDRDPVAASAWLNNRGPDPGLDVGLSTVAMMPNLIAHRPEVAVEWAQAITDPSIRAGALQSIADQWAREKPGALQQWLERNPNLPAPDRQALLQGATNTATGGGSP